MPAIPSILQQQSELLVEPRDGASTRTEGRWRIADVRLARKRRVDRQARAIVVRVVVVVVAHVLWDILDYHGAVQAVEGCAVAPWNV